MYFCTSNHQQSSSFLFLMTSKFASIEFGSCFFGLSEHYQTELVVYSLCKSKLTFSLNFIRLLRVVIPPSVTSLLRGESDSKQSDEFQANLLFVHHEQVLEVIRHQEMEEGMKMKRITVTRTPRTRTREVVQDLSVIRMANSQNFLLGEETETGCKNKVWIKYSRLKELNQKANIFATPVVIMLSLLISIFLTCFLHFWLTLVYYINFHTV